jgi:hypothetical protein
MVVDSWSWSVGVFDGFASVDDEDAFVVSARAEEGSEIRIVRLSVLMSSGKIRHYRRAEGLR